MSLDDREQYEAWFRIEYGQEPMPRTSPAHDFCWAGYKAGLESLRRQLAERETRLASALTTLSITGQQLSKAQTQSARRLEGLCKCGIEKDELKQQLSDMTQDRDNKFVLIQKFNDEFSDQIRREKQLTQQLAEAERDRQLCYACNTRLDEANDALYQRQGKPTYEQLERQLTSLRLQARGYDLESLERDNPYNPPMENL